MQVQGATDSFLCVAFSATLRKAAQAWYSRLPPQSIHSFRQLERAFLARFDAFRKIPRVTDNLFSIQQKSGESLRDYVARFKEAALEVYNLEVSMATLALKRGLRPSHFAYSLDKKPPSSYAELLSQAQKYIRADEADSSRREANGGITKKLARPEPAKVHPRRPEPPRRPNNRPRALAPRDGLFTPLLAPISHILLEIKGEPFLQRPPPLNPKNPRNKNLYCRFHRDHDHDTDNCHQQKKVIEDLIQCGHLGKFVQRNNPGAPGPSAPPPPMIDNALTKKSVAMIS